VVIEVLRAHARAAVRVRIVAPTEYARVRQVAREEVAQPVDAAACRPCLLAVSVQAVDGDDAAVLLAANEQTSSEKHTRRLGWCLRLLPASRAQLQQLALPALRMLRMSRVLQQPACVLVRGRWKAPYETHRRLALLRAEVKKPSHRVASGSGPTGA
jgi:hypothetical protein